jgi:hypothetical protein
MSVSDVGRLKISRVYTFRVAAHVSAVDLEADLGRVALPGNDDADPLEFVVSEVVGICTD